jgi:hypothetical protein
MDTIVSESLETRKDFARNPRDQYAYWCTELKASGKLLEDFHNQGTKIIEKFKGGKKRGLPAEIKRATAGFRINLFHSNVITLQSMLYGNLPKVDVSRRFNDPNDDTGRVAAEIMERLLTNDIQDNGKEYNSVLRACLQDRLLPGLGCARVRYEVETEKVPQVDETGVTVEVERVVREDAPIDYYHWRDVCYGWGRTFSELPWVAFRNYMTKDEFKARFPAADADKVELKVQSVTDEKDASQDSDEKGPWKRAEIWEIWDKIERKVVWVSIGYDDVLETKEDPLGLSGFFPNPPFLLANQTTSLYVPTADYVLAQDLYNEIDLLQTRISILTEAVKVVGVYDASAEEVQRMFNEGVDNELIPVEKWAMFSEKGGLDGQIDWVPIEAVVAALGKLRELRDETIGLLQQVTGMSDIMRGELGGQYEGVGQSQLKAKFGSVRVQAMQDEFATFASDLLQLKAETICRHFEPRTIVRMSNIDSSFDVEAIPKAIELLKDYDLARLKVEIRPESVAMVDYAQLKQERTEYLTALATFMQSAQPLMDADPHAKPFLLQLLQWGLAGFKGSSEIEGVLDKAIQASQKEAEEGAGKPDPAQQAERMKMAMAMKLEQTKHENNMKEIAVKAQADAQTLQAETQSDLAKVSAELRANLQEIAAKMSADIRAEAYQSQINAEQQAAAVQQEMEKEFMKTALKIEELEKAAKLKPKEGGKDA